MSYTTITAALLNDYPGARVSSEGRTGNFIVELGTQARFHEALIGRLNRGVYAGYSLLQDQGRGRIAVMKVA